MLMSGRGGVGEAGGGWRGRWLGRWVTGAGGGIGGPWLVVRGGRGLASSGNQCRGGAGMRFGRRMCDVVVSELD